MPNPKADLKPQYEGKRSSVIPLQKSKVDRKSEFPSLSKIIEESRKLEESITSNPQLVL